MCLLKVDNIPLLLLGTLFYFIGLSSCQYDSVHLFARVQCKTSCMGFFVKNKTQSLESLNKQFNFPSGNSFGRTDYDSCINSSRRCVTDCFGGCSMPIERDKSNRCSKCTTSMCTLGCRVLHSVVFEMPRQGECPSPQSMGVSDKGVCDKRCSSDDSCYNPLHKCCMFGCSRKCIMPMSYNESVPALTKLVPTSTKKGLEFNWTVPYRDNIIKYGPMMFILQVRVCMCDEFVEELLTEWRTIYINYNLIIELDLFERGRNYQFRLAAVSAYGTQGYGPPSAPYIPNKVLPQIPSPPRNVTDSLERIFADGKISVQITWKKPEHQDVPIQKYEISWVVDHGYVQPDGKSLESLTRYTQNVAKDQESFTIDGLSPDTSYKVQVRAISYWCNKKALVSQPNTHFISTLSFKPRRSEMDDVLLSTLDEDNCKCNETQLTAPELDISAPRYTRDKLALDLRMRSGNGIPYLVEWEPKVCIDTQYSTTNQVREVHKATLRNHVRLTNLNFNCRYSLRVSPMGNRISKVRGSSPEIKSCFCTPPCADVPIEIGANSPNCPIEKFRLPSPPVKLETELLNSETLSYKVSWMSPPLPKPRQPHTGTYSAALKDPRERERRSQSDYMASFSDQTLRYRVVWAPREKEPVKKELYDDAAGFSPILDSGNSNVRVLGKNVTSLVLHNLKRATFYIVRVQTLSILDGQESESPNAVHYFTTLGFKDEFGLENPEIARYIKRPSNGSFLLRPSSISFIPFILLLLNITISLSSFLVRGDYRS